MHLPTTMNSSVSDAWNRIEQQYPQFSLPLYAVQQQQKPEVQQPHYATLADHQKLDSSLYKLKKEQDRCYSDNARLLTLTSRLKTDLRNTSWTLSNLNHRIDSELPVLLREVNEGKVEQNKTKRDIVRLNEHVRNLERSLGDFEMISTRRQDSANEYINSVCLDLQAKMHKLMKKNEALEKKLEEFTQTPQQPQQQQLQQQQLQQQHHDLPTEVVEMELSTDSAAAKSVEYTTAQVINRLFNLPEYVDWRKLRVERTGALLSSKLKKNFFISKEKFKVSRKGTKILGQYAGEFMESVACSFPILYSSDGDSFEAVIENIPFYKS